jgi:hypothetical protein
VAPGHQVYHKILSMSQLIFSILVLGSIFNPKELGVISYFRQTAKANEYSSEILSTFGALLTTEDPLSESLLLKPSHSCLWREKSGGQVSWMSCSQFSKDVVDSRKYTANL